MLLPMWSHGAKSSKMLEFPRPVPTDRYLFDFFRLVVRVLLYLKCLCADFQLLLIVFGNSTSVSTWRPWRPNCMIRATSDFPHPSETVPPVQFSFRLVSLVPFDLQVPHAKSCPLKFLGCTCSSVRKIALKVPPPRPSRILILHALSIVPISVPVSHKYLRHLSS